jgi:hypothetical protein
VPGVTGTPGQATSSEAPTWQFIVFYACQHFQKSIYVAKNPLRQGNVTAHGNMPGDAGMTFEKIRSKTEVYTVFTVCIGVSTYLCLILNDISSSAAADPRRSRPRPAF